jgi:hypothetical protein
MEFLLALAFAPAKAPVPPWSIGVPRNLIHHAVGRAQRRQNDRSADNNIR